jgi:hypothetical protein
MGGGGDSYHPKGHHTFKGAALEPWVLAAVHRQSSMELLPCHNYPTAHSCRMCYRLTAIIIQDAYLSAAAVMLVLGQLL